MNVVAAIRKAYPRLRRSRMVGIIHNGGTKRVYNCCLCGGKHQHVCKISCYNSG
jgi:hypothetical protein